MKATLNETPFFSAAVGRLEAVGEHGGSDVVTAPADRGLCRSEPAGRRLREVFDTLDGLESVGDASDLTRLLQLAAG